jgi:hypothetical protein
MSAALCSLVEEALDGACKDMRDQTSTAIDGKTLLKESDIVLARFKQQLEKNFTELVKFSSRMDLDISSTLDFGNLRLIEEDDLEAIIAMEGMIAHARNTDIEQYLCYTTRLDKLIPHTKIDESNDPMDPGQIGEAFKNALQPSGLRPDALRLAYRYFNNKVFHGLETVLVQANAILVGHGILPELDIAARSREATKNKRGKPRSKTDPVERAFSKGDEESSRSSSRNKEIFSIMQRLMHTSASTEGAVAASNAGGASVVGAAAPSSVAPMSNVAAWGSLQSGIMVGEQKVEVVAGDKLIGLLSSLENNMATGIEPVSGSKADLSEIIAQQLKALSDKQTLQAIDSTSTDIISVVTLLYEAIWEDATVPIPVKELIGRTQITVLKIALQDPGFFDSDEHPARVLLNTLAISGISWTETDGVADDPLYVKMQEVITRLIAEGSNKPELIEEILEDFRYFERRQLLEAQAVENRLKDADERTERLEEVRLYARQKIEERILDSETPGIVKEFLLIKFHKFLVHVILREGPGGASWKPIMNTIDVLLWTVDGERSSADLERFNRIKSRLLMNLGKALEVAGFKKKQINKSLKNLLKLQESFFQAKETVVSESAEDLGFEDWLADAKPIVDQHMPDLHETDEHMQQVSKIPIGIWMEFQGEGDQATRCTLAAKIDTIDKYIFVNAHGVKVIEKSRMGLARELKDGTVKVISEAPLINRAMETVIGKLRQVRAAAT